MNNKKIIFLLAFVAFLLTGCQERRNTTIDLAYQLSATSPDSALSILDGINQAKLGKSEMARFALVYTIAQDKNGLDVDNDSLLRIAYTYYKKRFSDSLYTKCEYYMGKYYMLNDSTEKALHCFFQSEKTAKIRNDFYTQSMAMIQISDILREYNSQLAIRYAQAAIAIYNKENKATVRNKVYALLNLAECISYSGEATMTNAISLAKKAAKIAYLGKDSSALADAYQDLSVFHSIEGKTDIALTYAKKAWSIHSPKDVSAQMALAYAYYSSDSLSNAKLILLELENDKNIFDRSSIYSLMRQIANKEGDYEAVNHYADSTETYLGREIEKKSKAKDIYYLSLLSKEKSASEVLRKNQLKSVVIVFLVIFSTFIIISVVFIYRLKTQHILLCQKRKENHLMQDIISKNGQITIMCDALAQKITILNKMQSLQSASKKQISLDETDWDELEVFLNSTDNDFTKRLHSDFPDLTRKDIRFLMLIKVHLPYKTIATAYHIETKSVRQKLFLLKDKLRLKEGGKSAREFIEKY